MSMNLRHAAALALVGWYLMVAPPDTGTYWNRLLGTTKRPLNEWSIVASFDSADKCEDRRETEVAQAVWEKYPKISRNIRAETPKAKPNDLTDEIANRDMREMNEQSARFACIATDDSRLKEK
jgi:hypothetical protein